MMGVTLQFNHNPLRVQLSCTETLSLLLNNRDTTAQHCSSIRLQLYHIATQRHCVFKNARKSHTWQWASGHVRQRLEECV